MRIPTDITQVAFTAGTVIDRVVGTTHDGWRRRLLAGCANPIVWYITDGLVNHFDGINKGTNPNNWSDLVGNQYFNFDSSKSTVESNAVLLNGTGGIQGSGGNGVPSAQTGTIEFCGQILTTGSTGFVFSGGGSPANYRLSIVKYGDGFMYCYGRKSPNLHRFSNFDTVIASPFSVSMNDDLGLLNGVQSISTGSNGFNNTPFCIGAKGATGYVVSARYYSIRCYNRKLSESEMLHNLRIDNARFNLGLNL